jgi:hypothetical protein
MRWSYSSTMILEERFFLRLGLCFYSNMRLRSERRKDDKFKIKIIGKL